MPQDAHVSLLSIYQRLGFSCVEEHRISLCRLSTTAATAIIIGLISSFGSHLSRFDINIWGMKMDEVPVGQGYSFTRQRLADLEGLIGHSVWVLGSNQSQIKMAGVKISLTIGELDDIWGAFVLDEGEDDNEAHYFLPMNRGFIVRSPRNEHSHVLGSETECHWVDELPASIPAIGEFGFLGSSSRILIGTDDHLESSENQSRVSSETSLASATGSDAGSTF
ncbi:hypothetical protein N7540_009735 [Penicillium herquei]|nr:hypothetical protein N7540_009735 [Penicillium herquei]